MDVVHMYEDDHRGDPGRMLDRRPPGRDASSLEGHCQRQSRLPFRHRKGTSPALSAGVVTTQMSAKSQPAAVCVPGEKGSAPVTSDARARARARATVAKPDVVVLSDSEGTAPISRPCNSSPRRATAATSAVPHASSSRRPSQERDVVILGSDTDEDVCSGATLGVHGQLNMSNDSKPNTFEKNMSVADGDRVSSRYRGDEARSTSSPTRDHLLSAPLHSVTADGYDSDPEWLRLPYAPAVASGKSRERIDDFVDHGRIEMGMTQDKPSQELTQGKPSQEFIDGSRIHSPALDSDLEPWADSCPEDKGRGKRRRNCTTTQANGALEDRTNVEDTAVPVSKRKQKSRVGRGPLSAEEAAAREAEKQREREAKKARQEEEKRAREEKREELKRQKQTAKEQEALHKKAERERERRIKGVNAEKHTRIYLDSRVAEMGSLASVLFQQLAVKGCKYKIRKQPVDGTILWRIVLPSRDSQTSPDEVGSQPAQLMGSQANFEGTVEKVDIQYVAVVLSGEEFAKKLADNTLSTHISEVRTVYPCYRICYIIMGLMKYLKIIEQKKYREGDVTWKRLPVEQALADFVTCYAGICHRLCIDGTEVADHIIGLTAGHAKVPFRPKLSSISMQANGNHIPRYDPNKDVIKKSAWLKMLVAIPNIPGATAIAIAKLYPTMRALLNAYLDPARADHEKELLLQSIVKDIPIGSSCSEGRRVGPVASKRIYRVLMAQNGSLRTDDAEDGADHFAPET